MATENKVAWESLNKRQQDYLVAIYNADQEVEKLEKSGFSLGYYARPAELWRWMPYATSSPSGLPRMVKKHLEWTNQISEGTGSTFEALERRGLILMQYLTAQEMRQRGMINEAEGFFESDPIPCIQITKAGRALVRKALEIAPITRMVPGTLRERYWKALARAYAARNDIGLEPAGRQQNYGGFYWDIWLRLKQYSLGVLVEEHRLEKPVRPWEPCVIRLTPFGRAFYERAHIRYSQLYPGIDAPLPETTVDPFEPYSVHVSGKETCRACRGYYLVDITRTYQQRRNWTWSVSDESARVPGEVIDEKYGRTFAQCQCNATDIVESHHGFMDVLDKLHEQGWSISIRFSPWFTTAGYLVTGSYYSARDRYYSPAFVKERLVPLLRETSVLDAQNLAKMEVIYFCNPDVGKGALFLVGHATQQHGEIALVRADPPDD